MTRDGISPCGSGKGGGGIRAADQCLLPACHRCEIPCRGLAETRRSHDTCPVTPYRNIHGRRGGRGLRPWLLSIKLLAVAAMFGGLCGSLVVCQLGLSWFATLPGGEALTRTAPLLRAMYLYLIVPALLAAILAGVGLLTLHARTLLRQRWLQVKLAILVVLVPIGHMVMSAQLAAVRQTAAQGLRDPAPLASFRNGVIMLIVAFGLVILLGRLKPRLGQNWAKVHARLPPS